MLISTSIFKDGDYIMKIWALLISTILITVGQIIKDENDED